MVFGVITAIMSGLFQPIMLIIYGNVVATILDRDLLISLNESNGTFENSTDVW